MAQNSLVVSDESSRELFSETASTSGERNVQTSNVPLAADQCSTYAATPNRSHVSIGGSTVAAVPKKFERDYVVHKYLINRPRVLQHETTTEARKTSDVESNSRMEIQSKATTEKIGSAANQPSEAATGKDETRGKRRSTDNIEVSRERLDLFIDLIWVGIISNISANFYEESFSGQSGPGNTASYSVLIFIVLFIPALELWSRLQSLLNAYYMDDLLQRCLIIWILFLGMAYGNQGPFAYLTNNSATERVISIYLIAVGSIRLTELLYSYWQPWTSRIHAIGFLLNLPAYGLWIAAFFSLGGQRLGLVWGAIGYERLASVFVDSPWSYRILHQSVRKVYNPHHLRKRYSSFFVIALGEGIFLLIRNSPLGMEFGPKYVKMFFALVIYFTSHALYFNGDQARHSIHATLRHWYVQALWKFLHVPIFGSVILMSNSLLYLVSYPEEVAESDSPEVSATTLVPMIRSIMHPRNHSNLESSTSSDDDITLLVAIGTSCLCLALFLLSTLGLAFLSKSHDPPRTLLINNRILRLTPRAIAVVVLSTMWLADFADTTLAVGSIMTVMSAVFVWEWIVSFERPFGIVEPKSGAIIKGS